MSNVQVDCVDEPPAVDLSPTAIGSGVVGFGSTAMQTITLTVDSVNA